MIDITVEHPLTLSQAARLIPPARGGKRCHISTIARWIISGTRALDGSIVRLEAARLGGRWITSREAIGRYMQRLTPRTDTPAPEMPRTPIARERACRRAADQLEGMGV
jgi:hypothetical protein